MPIDLMTDTDDIEVLYARFEDLLIRCFAAAYSGAAWDLPSQFNLAQTRADLRRHRQFDRGPVRRRRGLWWLSSCPL
jgi:hypothetical protein